MYRTVDELIAAIRELGAKEVRHAMKAEMEDWLSRHPQSATAESVPEPWRPCCEIIDEESEAG